MPVSDNKALTEETVVLSLVLLRGGKLSDTMVTSDGFFLSRGQSLEDTIEWKEHVRGILHVQPHGIYKPNEHFGAKLRYPYPPDTPECRTKKSLKSGV